MHKDFLSYLNTIFTKYLIMNRILSSFIKFYQIFISFIFGLSDCYNNKKKFE
jgi:hypothetical protein